MSLVVGDLDSDGEGERIVFEPYHSSSLLNSETALLFLSVAALAAVTACCWCGYYAASKRKRLSAYFHKLHEPSAVAEPAATETKPPPPPASVDCLAYAYYLQPHLSPGALLPLPQSHTSLEMKCHPPSFLQMAHYGPL